jgi:hypothetical protein
VSNFDRQFTSEKTDLTPTDKLFMMNLDQVSVELKLCLAFFFPSDAPDK